MKDTCRPGKMGNNGARGAGGVQRGRFSKGWWWGGARPQVAAAAGGISGALGATGQGTDLLQEGGAPARA